MLPSQSLCQYDHYQQHHDPQEMLAGGWFSNNTNNNNDNNNNDNNNNNHNNNNNNKRLSGNVSWWMRTKPKIWSTFDEPYSSPTAKVYPCHQH